MTRQIRSVALAALLAPACLTAQKQWVVPQPAASGMNMLDGQAGPVYGKPFTATEVRHTSQVLADGTHVDRSDTSQFIRDDKGRMRTSNEKSILIFDPVAGYNYGLDLPAKTYERTALPAKLNVVSIAVAGGRSSTTTSSGDGNRRITFRGALTEELPPQMVNGIYAKGSRVTMTIPTGTFGNDRDMKVINERWYSDDLQVLLKSTNSDPRFGVTTYELTNIVQVQPDPALFLVPAEFRQK